MLSGLGQRAHNTPHMPQLREHGRGHNAEAAQNIQNPTATLTQNDVQPESRSDHPNPLNPKP